jgi:hypothetical protein
MQIRPWIEAYGTEAVHLTSLEALQKDPHRVLSEVATFIGYRRNVNWFEARSRENASTERFRKLPLHGLIMDHPLATTLRRTLVPQSIRDRIKRARVMSHRPELPDTLRGRLEEKYAQDYNELVSFFPNNADLSAGYPFMAS